MTACPSNQPILITFYIVPVVNDLIIPGNFSVAHMTAIIVITLFFNKLVPKSYLACC